MEQEIDLREIMAALFKYKFWIAALAVVAAVAAAIVSTMLAPTYQATALVVVARPQYRMQFDDSFAPISGNIAPPYKAYPLLAMSDEVVAALIADLGDELLARERTVQAMRPKLEAQNGAEPSVIRLRVQDGDSERAAVIANRWAERFVRAANDLYAQSSAEYAFFVEQQTEAGAALAQAEEALIGFQARNQASILETRLLQLHTTLANDHEAAHSLEMIIGNARALRERLQASEITAAASLSDELTALLIEISALDRGGSGVQLQIPAQPNLGSKTVGDQITFLDSLILVLENRLVLLEEQTSALEPEILSLQRAYQEALTEGDRLTVAQELARDTFMSLSRKATEARIADQATGDVRLASRATPATSAVSPRRTLNILVAGAVGLMVGVVAALAVEYWRKGRAGTSSG